MSTVWLPAAPFLPMALQAAQFRTLINTVLSLLGSCLSTFAVSALVENKFSMVHIQVAIHIFLQLAQHLLMIKMIGKFTQTPSQGNRVLCSPRKQCIVRCRTPALPEGWPLDRPPICCLLQAVRCPCGSSSCHVLSPATASEPDSLDQGVLLCPGALAVGLAAGAVTTLGYAYVQPALEKKIGLGDTCGVHNLHGMPGVLGGLVR